MLNSENKYKLFNIQLKLRCELGIKIADDFLFVKKIDNKIEIEDVYLKRECYALELF